MGFVRWEAALGLTVQPPGEGDTRRLRGGLHTIFGPNGVSDVHAALRLSYGWRDVTNSQKQRESQ